MTVDGADHNVGIAFVCVQNAGRSQMAYAFAKRALRERGLEDEVELVTGGTDPAETVHPNVVATMREVGIDLADRQPQEVTLGAVADSDLVVTMGCSASRICPATWSGENRDWDLEDPHGKGLDECRRIRDAVERHVAALFDDLEEELAGE